MACILHIETSTTVCSVAVSDDSQCIYHDEDHSGPNHAERLGTMVDEALSFTDSHAIPFDAVAVSSGPGSYTGLRIGVSMAKGICYGRDLKLIAVPTLQLLCVPVLLMEKVVEAKVIDHSPLNIDHSPLNIDHSSLNIDHSSDVQAMVRSSSARLYSQSLKNGQSSMVNKTTTLPDDALLCPMQDARRMEVYAALYDRALREVRPIAADVVTADTYRQWLDERPVYFFGNGAAKCMGAIAHPNAHFIPEVEPLAKWMQPLAERRLLNGETEDVAYFEPFYLKDFVAIKPKSLL